MLTKYQKKINPGLPIEIAEIQSRTFVRVAKEKDAPLALIVAISQYETGQTFNPMSLNKQSGASGAMQLLSCKEPFDQNRLFDIGYNIEKGWDCLEEKLTANDNDLSQSLGDYSGGAKWYVDGIYATYAKVNIYLTMPKFRVSDPKLVVVKKGKTKRST